MHGTHGTQLNDRDRSMMARWAPLVLPLRRRLETLAVVVWASALFLVLLVVAVFVATPWLWPFTMAYMLFMFVDDAPTHGGRVLPLMRRLPVRLEPAATSERTDAAALPGAAD